MKYQSIGLGMVLLFASTVLSAQQKPASMKKEINSKTIVFIHGLFMNNHTWEPWVDFFEKEGYTCYAPAHPKHAGEPAALRANPPVGLENVQFQDWIVELEKLIDSLPEKPIFIGHSFGGLTAQKLVESGRAEAAILISSAPPKGIRSFKWSFLKANLKVVSPRKGQSIFNPEEEDYKKWFHRSIANTLSKAESDVLFEAFVVPESRETPRASLEDIAAINTSKSHVPLFFVGGKEDVIVPNVLLQKTVKAYTDPESVVESKFYEAKDHMLCAAPGWEAVAQDCLDWLKG